MPVLNRVLTRGHTYHTHTHTYRNCTSTPMHTCVIHLTQCTCAYTCMPHTRVWVHTHTVTHTCPHAHTHTSPSDWLPLASWMAQARGLGDSESHNGLDGGVGGALPPGPLGEVAEGALEPRRAPCCPPFSMAVGGWPMARDSLGGPGRAGTCGVSGCDTGALAGSLGPLASVLASSPPSRMPPLLYWSSISLLCPCRIVSHSLTLAT